MNRLSLPGVALLVMSFIIGVWLIVSPFVMQSQAVGAAWSRGAINNVAAGGLLVGIALFGVGGYVVFALRDALWAASQKPQERADGPTVASA